MAIFFGTERCDGAKDQQAAVNVNTYYNESSGVKIANIAGTDIYAPYEAQPDVTVTPYYNSSSGVKIATVSGKDVYAPTSFSNQTGNMIVGSIMAWAGNGTIPDGWLLCDGSEVSKALYNELYQVIRDDYGTPKNKNNFVLPKITDTRYLQGNTKAGTKLNAGLPNIKGETVSNDGNTIYSPYATGYSGEQKDLYSNGALYIAPPNTKPNLNIVGINGTNKDRADGILSFDASKSNSIYGNSTTVTPTSITVRYLICWKNMIPTQLQIAMPNWLTSLIKDIKSECHKSAGSGYAVTANGYILFLEIDDGRSGISWSGQINGNYVFYTARSPQSYWENTNLQMIPVSTGDIVLTEGTYGPNAKVLFIPCKELKEINSEVKLVKSWNDDITGGWYRLYSDGWCEQGGYTCTEDGKFAENTTYVSVYQCLILTWLPYANNKYRAFVAAESTYNNGGGNCGYDYIIPGSKTINSFKAIMCAYSTTGSLKNHYYRQYWETKGYVTLNNETSTPALIPNNNLLKVSVEFKLNFNATNGQLLYSFNTTGKYLIKIRLQAPIYGAAFETEILYNGKLIHLVGSDNHDATPTEFYVNASSGDKLNFGQTINWTNPNSPVGSFTGLNILFMLYKVV